MRYWLIKSEPASFSWSDQVKNGVEPWTGVRNYQARNNLLAMRIRDQAMFYHSVTERRIVGIVEIVREAYPDSSADDGKRWVCVDVKAIASLPKPIRLSTIKEDSALEQIALIRQSRLSVCPITAEEWHHLCRLGDYLPPADHS